MRAFPNVRQIGVSDGDTEKAPAGAFPPLLCPVCGSDMRLIAAVTEREPVQRILRHIAEPPLPPPVSPACSPPLWDTVDWDQSPGQDPEADEPAPEFAFDQTVSW